MALISTNLNSDGVPRHSMGSRTGTRTAANFTITLGFVPRKIRVVNLTDRVDATFYVDSTLDGGSNGKGLLQVAAGTTTYADVGIAVYGRTFTVTVATVGLETDNDDVIWEAWG